MKGVKAAYPLALLTIPVVSAYGFCEICNQNQCQCSQLTVENKNSSDDDSLGHLSDGSITFPGDEDDKKLSGQTVIESLQNHYSETVSANLATTDDFKRHHIKEKPCDPRLLEHFSHRRQLHLPPAQSDPEHFETEIRALFGRLPMGVSSLEVSYVLNQNYRRIRRAINLGQVILAGFDSDWMLLVPYGTNSAEVPMMGFSVFEANQSEPVTPSLIRRDALMSMLMDRVLICAFTITMLDL